MDTYEARLTMRDLAREALEIVEDLVGDAVPSRDNRKDLRSMAVEARELLPDAGYPGEATWRGLQRASIGADTHFDQADPSFWVDVADELRNAAATLDQLVGPVHRDIAFHIVG